LILDKLTFETVVLSKDGRRVPVEISSQVVKLSGEKVVLSIIRDITERKKAQKALEASEERYRILNETSPDAIAVHDNSILTYINSACVELLGENKAEDMIGKNITDYIPNKWRDSIRNRISRVLSGEIERDFFRGDIKNIDGKVIYIETSSSAIYIKGKRMILTIIRDVTERKRAERLQQEVEINEKLLIKEREYDKLKTQFFSNVSHELKTPLSSSLLTWILPS